MVPFVGLAFSPLGWLAGLVTRLNRHGYFISRPPKRADPTHDPRKLRNGGPRVYSWMNLGRHCRSYRFAVQNRRIKSSALAPHFSLNC